MLGAVRPSARRLAPISQAAAGCFAFGRPSRNAARRGSKPARSPAPAVRLATRPARVTMRERKSSKSASTPAQSCSTRRDSSRRASSAATPPRCSAARPAGLWPARSRVMTTRCPPGIRPCSMRALSSSTMSPKRSWSEKSVSASTSARMSSMSWPRPATALACTKSRAMAPAGRPPGPRTPVARGAASMPPVVLAMRRDRASKGVFLVPISVRARPKSGTRGSRRRGTGARSKPRSRYTMPEQSRSWVSSRSALPCRSSAGMGCSLRGMSARVRRGMAARAAGSSGAAWSRASSAASSATAVCSASGMAARAASRAARSAASRVSSRAGSGVSTRVTRCGLSTRCSFTRSAKSGSPAARRDLMRARLSAKPRASSGSPP